MGFLSALTIALATWTWLAAPSRTRLREVHARIPIGESGSTRTRSREPHPRDRRASLLAQAPVVADLLATAVSAGASVHEGVRIIAEAVEDPIRTRLRAVAAALEFGAGPHAAWSDWLEQPALAPMAQAIIRSQHSGAPVSSVLDAVADEMRQAHRSDVEMRARAAGVRAVAPLALCFLPAFLLVGVVPVVAGFAEALFS